MRSTVARGLSASLAVLLGLGLLLAAVGAEAQDGAERLPLELRFRAPVGCPDGAYVERRVHRIVHVRSDAELPRVEAEGEVELLPGGRHRLFLATRVDGMPGERVLEGSSCAALADAAALVLAIAFGPGVEVEEPVEEPAAPPSPTPEPAAPSPAVPEAVAAPPPRSGVGLRVLGLVECELLPGCGGGGALGADFVRRRLALEAEVRFVGERYRALAAAPGVEGRFRATYGSVSACMEGVFPSAALRACGRARFGYAYGESRGALVDGSSRAPIGALGAGVSARFPGTRRVALEVGAELALSLYRPRFSIENVGAVHTVGLVLPSVFVGGRFGVGSR